MAENDEATTREPKTSKAKTARKHRRKPKSTRSRDPKPHSSRAAAFPRHAVRKALRIPKAILEQNAGKACTDREAVKFAGLAFHGPSRVEISSAIKYGFLERPTPGNVSVTDLAKKILRPQKPNEELDGLREAVLNAPTVADVYKHYRGEMSPTMSSFETPS